MSKNTLFPMTDNDRKVYEEELAPFLPEKMIDAHTHVWLKQHKHEEPAGTKRTVTWPSLVAPDNSVEDHLESYRLLFPDKMVTPMIFSSITRSDDEAAMNAYIAESAEKHRLPALMYAFPEWSGETLYTKITAGKFLGVKVYLNLSPAYIPVSEIRIFDFIPHHQLEVLNKYGMILMLHIPRDERLKDPVNLAQMLEIEERYPNVRVIYAHIGRAYCHEDIGTAFEQLKQTSRLVFDFSANTCSEAMAGMIDCVGPQRVLFGSDLPILRMRMRRICEKGRYINIVPRGLYGDVSNDSHMREVDGEEAEQLTFFMYEELRAFKKAATDMGLSRQDLEDAFYNNADRLIQGARKSMYG